MEADYTSTEIAKTWDLIDKWIVLHVARSNIRKIPAFHNGKPLGMCTPGGRWQWSDHSIDLRQYINQLTREGYIENDFKGDVVAAFTEQLGRDAVSTKNAKKAAKPSVRQLGDHLIRREKASAVDEEASSQEAAQAVHELLNRASESSSSSEYMQWDDIGAFNGDGHGY